MCKSVSVSGWGLISITASFKKGQKRSRNILEGWLLVIKPQAAEIQCNSSEKFVEILQLDKIIQNKCGRHDK